MHLANRGRDAIDRFLKHSETFQFFDEARTCLVEARDCVRQLPDGIDTREILTSVLMALNDLPADHPKDPIDRRDRLDEDKFLFLSYKYYDAGFALAKEFQDKHRESLRASIAKLETIALLTDPFPELETLNDSARAMLRVGMYLEANAESVKFSEIEEYLDTSNTTNKKYRKALVDGGLLKQEGRGSNAKWRVTNRGVELANFLKETVWGTFKVP